MKCGKSGVTTNLPEPLLSNLAYNTIQTTHLEPGLIDFRDELALTEVTEAEPQHSAAPAVHHKRLRYGSRKARAPTSLRHSSFAREVAGQLAN